MADDRKKVLEAGMNDHISKPIDLVILGRKLIRWIKPRQTQSNGKTTEKIELPKNGTNSLPFLPGIDIEQGLKNINYRGDYYRKYLLMFAKLNQDFSAQWTAALANNNQKEAIRLAHSLKGNAASLGMLELEEAAGQLEKASREKLKCLDTYQAEVMAKLDEIFTGLIRLHLQ